MVGIESPKKSISEAGYRNTNLTVQIVLFGVFLLLGGVLFAVFFVIPAYETVKAKNWMETPCIVVSSTVGSHRGTKGGYTYSIDIRYAYRVDGKWYHSERYQFLRGSSSGYERKWAVVRSHPVGQRTICYVNPADPRDAVMERAFTSDLYVGLIPLVFFGIGLLGLFYTIRGMRKRSGTLPSSSWMPRGAQARTQIGPGSTTPSFASSAEALVLKPRASPITKLVGMSCVAAFWNGIIAVFIFQVFEGWRSGSPNWFLTLFLIPFVLVGIGTLVGVGYFLLAVFNPRLKLIVHPGAILLGESADLEWEISGRVERIRRFCIRLEGRQEATYRSGKSTRTDKAVFARTDLVNTQSPGNMLHGTARAAIPKDPVPSLECAHNKIVWLLSVRGDIGHWPDIKEEFPIVVLPLDYSTRVRP